MHSHNSLMPINSQMHRLPQVYKLNTYELQRRAGEMKSTNIEVLVIELIYIQPVRLLVDARLESVTEGFIKCASFCNCQGESRGA